MQVISAEFMGFCFGVRDALKVIDSVAQPELVTIRGELVHNPDIIATLASRGFQQQPEQAEDSGLRTRQVLVTAHGISDTERSRLLNAGHELIDTTCPLVRRAHQAASTLAREGRFVVVIGRPGHVEVRGLVGDLSNYCIVEQESAVETWPTNRIGIVCQTTTPPEVANRLRELIVARNPQAEIRFANTVCQPTVDRLQAVDDLIPRVDMMIVVGGRNSNNTTRLVERCTQAGVPARHVESADELQQEWFENCRVVGLTAGTSTPDHVIDAVAVALRALPPALEPPRSEWTSADWCRYYRRNREHYKQIPEIPWETATALTDAERQAIGRSVATFQLGESGEGRHLLRCAEEHGEAIKDPQYLPATRAFIEEEHRHSAWLGQFLDVAGVPRLQREWSNGIFRWLRHRAGLELTIVTLVSAEMLAKVYYAALRDATDSLALQALCRHILKDEVAHVQFQCQRLEALRSRNPSWLKSLKHQLHRLLYAGTLLVVWYGHRSVFRAAQFSWKHYHRRAWHAFHQR